MPKTLSATFASTHWTEVDIETAPEGTLRHTTLDYGVTYKGDGIVGASTINDVMVYRSEMSVPFMGYEFFRGEIDGRSGSIVFQHLGLFDETGANANITVVPDTGTGDLAGFTCTGKMHAPSTEGTLTLVIE